jgi:adenosine deaminase
MMDRHFFIGSMVRSMHVLRQAVAGKACFSSGVVLALMSVAGAADAQTPSADMGEQVQSVAARDADFTATSRLLEKIRQNPGRLASFMREFPKGADLHNHLSGAVWAEKYLDWAAEDGKCADLDTHRITPSPCRDGSIPATSLASDAAARERMIDALSMRDFVPDVNDRSGHDHFFATFEKFQSATEGHEGDMLAEALQQAAYDHVHYLELMVSPRLVEAARAGAKLKVGTDESIRQALDGVKAGNQALVVGARADMDSAEGRAREILQCGTPSAAAGCAVSVHYLYQALRTIPPGMVLSQLALGHELVRTDPRFVGVNIVAPEDDVTAMRDYNLHMRMFHVLAKEFPDVPLSLHAGELAPGLVPPEGLHSHIRQAVEIAGARRIGHGVDIMQEDDPVGLMAEMAKKHVMVEINLTSNDEILGVKGAAHPLMSYRAHHVPVALSTDDEGVSRGDLTTEYSRAVRDYPLSYADMKGLSRAGLEYSFVPGESLWENAGIWKMKPSCAAASPDAYPETGECHDLLMASEKARLQWKLEEDFVRFEHRASENSF